MQGQNHFKLHFIFESHVIVYNSCCYIDCIQRVVLCFKIHINLLQNWLLSMAKIDTATFVCV